jgi:phosphoserine phosphatase
MPCSAGRVPREYVEKWVCAAEHRAWPASSAYVPEVRTKAGQNHGLVCLASRPLAVDLDGTLVSTDMPVESASAVVIRQPLASVRLLSWLRAGKAQLKHELAKRASIDAATLPYHGEVLDWLRAEHAGGRRLVLASASDERIVRQVADHLGTFEAAHGSAPDFNCRSSAKRDLFVRTYGVRGYDYVGDHRHDLPVWASGSTAHVVGSERLVAKAAGVSSVGRTFAPARQNLRAVVRAVRPRQWVKNLLVALTLGLGVRASCRP